MTDDSIAQILLSATGVFITYLAIDLWKRRDKSGSPAIQIARRAESVFGYFGAAIGIVAVFVMCAIGLFLFVQFVKWAWSF